MNDKFQQLKEVVRQKKRLILSVDLDDTLVIRELGPNYVPPATLAVFKKIVANNKATVLINTGRERYGYAAFCQHVIDVKNAILGSGSVVEFGGEYHLDPQSEIEPALVKAILQLVREKKLPFVDFAHFFDRTIVHNLDRYSALFFAQNPAAWFANYPKVNHIDEQSSYPEVFRAEFLVAKKDYPNLFNDLGDKRNNCFPLFEEILGADVKLERKYLLKRKSYFKEMLRDEVTFARLEVNETEVNKGTGLKLWFEKSGIKADECSVIHIGDRDHGVVNDTIIKSVLPESLIVMVGDEFDKKNPLVDLYFEGHIDDSVRAILTAISEALD